MKHLLKIEWLKLKKYTAFNVLSIFFVIGVFSANYVVYSFNKNVIGSVNAGRLISFSPYNFENTWQTTSYVTGFILILPAMLLLLLFTNEYTYKTHRQNIIDGLSRQQFIAVKLMMAFLFALIATVMVSICAAIFGFASGTNFSTTGMKYIGYFFLKALTYNLFAVLISVLVKRTGFAIGIFFIYLGAENFISQLLVFLSMRLKEIEGVDLGNLGDYLPLNAADGLLTFPKNTITDMAKAMLPADFTWLVLGLALIYLILFFSWSRRKFISADL